MSSKKINSLFVLGVIVALLTATLPTAPVFAEGPLPQWPRQLPPIAKADEFIAKGLQELGRIISYNKVKIRPEVLATGRSFIQSLWQVADASNAKVVTATTAARKTAIAFLVQVSKGVTLWTPVIMIGPQQGWDWRYPYGYSPGPVNN